MKKIHQSILFSLIIFCIPLWNLSGQEDASADSLGLPGDHFSLEGALELFKKASSPEAFEKLLNQEENGINNLDLDQDGKVDYITVKDLSEKDAHSFVLSVPVSKTESQDIAVIELEKNGTESAVLQIIGDADIYGDERIIEPYDDKAIQSEDAKHGPSGLEETMPIVVNVWGWPCVAFVYRPVYVPWISPFRWAFWPGWWRPWGVHPWRYHWSRCHHFHAIYRPAPVHRVVVAHRVYAPHRVTSKTVVTRNSVTINNFRNSQGKHRSTTTTIKHDGPDRDHRADQKVKVTRSSTEVERNGKRNDTEVKRTKTEVDVHTKNRDVKATKTTKKVKKSRN